MAIHVIAALLVCLAITAALQVAIARYRRLSVLSHVPKAHWSVPYSSLWIIRQRQLQRDTLIVHDLHCKLGPLVRLAPAEISVNCIDGGVRTIYAGGFEKGSFYRNGFRNYGLDPMFTMSAHETHSKRKRMLSNVYAKSTLHSSASMAAIRRALIYDLFIPQLRLLSGSSASVEFYDIFRCVTIDVVTAYIFGLKNGSNFLSTPAKAEEFFDRYKARHLSQFWPQNFPGLINVLCLLRLSWILIPSWADEANRAIETWLLARCEAAETTLLGADDSVKSTADWPNVYSQLRSNLSKESGLPTQVATDASIPTCSRHQSLSVASELMDHTVAGFDTSSITLTFLAWRLSQEENRKWQRDLREDLQTLKDKTDPNQIDQLPVLHAVLMETLRLHPAIPGNQPRQAPAHAKLGPKGGCITDVPAGVNVHAQAWSLHRNERVFPAPEEWNPSRWLDSDEEQLKEMRRWFWAFSSGGRMCIGSNLAMLSMKSIASTLWAEFETSVVDDSGMIQSGGYSGEPVGRNGVVLKLKIRPVN